MKYYLCPICNTQIMYEFDGMKQENAGMRITKHVKLHSLGEIIEFLEMEIVDNFIDTNSPVSTKLTDHGESK